MTPKKTNTWYVISQTLLTKFDVDIFSETTSKEALRPLIRNKLVPQLRQKLAQFSHDLIETHGKDVYNPNMNATPNSSVTATPVVSKPPTPAPTAHEKAKAVNTTNLTDDIEFTATAQDLYSAFIDQDKLAKWTRNSVQIDPKVGGEFVLFQGNIRGKFLALEEGKKIEQTWRLSSWPEGTLFPKRSNDRSLLHIEDEFRPRHEHDDAPSSMERSTSLRRRRHQEEIRSILRSRNQVSPPSHPHSGKAESLRSRHIAGIKQTWSMDKVAATVAVGAGLIAIVYRYTFGYGLLL